MVIKSWIFLGLNKRGVYQGFGGWGLEEADRPLLKFDVPRRRSDRSTAARRLKKKKKIKPFAGCVPETDEILVKLKSISRIHR